MRRLAPILVALLAVFALGGAAVAQPEGEAARRRAGVQGHQDPTASSNDNFGQIVYNHFGNPAAGQAVIQGWIHQTYGETAFPASAQAVGQGTRLHNVARIAIQVRLRTSGGAETFPLAIGDTVNSGTLGNPRIFGATSPRVASDFDGATQPPWCQAWWEILYAIRWTDGTLSSSTLVAPADLWNDNCYFINP
jgi:hypothetical protein